ncbi:hypothetical protein JD276_04405 [Leucobacter sp. CSA1]|uniref:Uncharacterized protein n=1 Tax=Leucobacter chromiisoli TaxID=2796471 RepID=A0A934Q7I6_9MICO|nr:hypothetical protein [Leucobacter chromiisoli]MBK0418272.1 hypothetical protein [Leucobacter chromiisoli]
MAWLVPYVINGAQHTASLFRRQAQRPATDTSGVARPDDLKVTQLPQAEAGVRIMPGGLTIQSRFPNRDRESYGVENADGAVDITGLTGTTSAARRDAVIVQVLDPNYMAITHEAAALENYTRVTVVQDVSTSAKQIGDIPSMNGVTGYVLAFIDWPANQTVVQGSYIKDARKLASPKRTDGTTIAYPTGATTTGRRIPNGPTAYGDWPLEGNERPLVEIPTWATYILVTAIVEGAWYAGGSNTTANTVGATRVALGGQYSENGILVKGQDDRGDRHGFAIIGRVAIPEAMRGTTQRLSLQGVRTSASNTGGWFVDYQSCISMTWVFSETT